MINKKVNCIIPAYNVGRYLVDAVMSVVNQTIGFENINLVIVNDGSTDNSVEIIHAFVNLYPEIVYISQDNAGVSAARNAGLDFCMENSNAPYTCFLDGDDKYDRYHMELLCDFLESQSEHNSSSVVFMPIKWFEKLNTIHYAYKTFDRGKTGLLNLETKKFHFSHVNSGVFRTESITSIRFDETISISEDSDFILKVLVKNSTVGWYNNGKTFYNLRKRMDETSAIDNSSQNRSFYERPFYLREKFEKYLETLGYIPRVVQTNVIYDLRWYHEYDSPKLDPRLYGIDIDVNQAIENIRFIISNIDDDILNQNYIPYWCKAYFKFLKNGDISIRKLPNEVAPVFCFGDEPFEGLSGAISVRYINQRDQTLRIRGSFVKPTIDGIDLIVRMGNLEKKADIKPSNYAGRNFYFGREIFASIDYDVNIDCHFFTETIYNLEILFKYGNYYSQAKMRHSWFSRLSNSDFFIGDNVVVSSLKKPNTLKIEKLNQQHINKMLLNRKNEFKDPLLIEKYVENFEAFRNRRIWLFIDRHNQIGDNAESLFRYCEKIDSDIEKYMVVPDEEYIEKFTDHSNILVYGSMQYKIYLLFAEKYISSTTFIDSNVDTNISKEDFRRTTNVLANFEEIFLQHGVLQNKNTMLGYLNKNRRDFALFTVASQKEYESVLRNTGFDANIVKLVGMCRFDNLKSAPERIITVAFTWRVTLADAGNRGYNPNFSKSKYYHMYNNFINDSKLILALKDHGYKLIVKLHPELYVQKDDFIISDGVQLVENEISYNELYEKSSLMISDVSSMLFDFAYLKKPIIYYQDEDTPPNYGENDPDTFCFHTDGFGNVTKTKDETVNLVISFMKKKCLMTKVYKQRVEEFFAFNDRNNCQRVYDEILSLDHRSKGRI